MSWPKDACLLSSDLWLYHCKDSIQSPSRLPLVGILPAPRRWSSKVLFKFLFLCYLCRTSVLCQDCALKIPHFSAGFSSLVSSSQSSFCQHPWHMHPQHFFLIFFFFWIWKTHFPNFFYWEVLSALVLQATPTGHFFPFSVATLNKLSVLLSFSQLVFPFQRFLLLHKTHLIKVTRNTSVKTLLVYFIQA